MKTLRYQVRSCRTNNLNALRLILALAVVASHSCLICQGPEPLVVLSKGQMSMGSAAVNLFFFLSGFLITASWLRSPNMQTYLVNRILRIYPGFVAAMVFSGMVIWGFCPDFRAEVGHGLSWAVKFVKDCMFLTFYSLGWDGVFADNPVPLVANGSLWTIQKEFGCYLLVAISGMFGLFKFRRLQLAAAIIVTLCYWLMEVFPAGLPVENFRLASYFLLGVNVWLWRDRILLSGKLAVVCLVALLLSVFVRPCLIFLFPAAAGYLMLWLGYGSERIFLAWTRRTDLSYGVYLFAWPIQQIFAIDERLRNPYVNLALTLPILVAIAWLSWTLIERRFLQLKGLVARDYDPGDGTARDLSIPSERVASQG